MTGRLVLVLGDSLAYELTLALLCKVERHGLSATTAGLQPTVFGPDHLRSQPAKNNATTAPTSRARDDEARLIAQLWPGWPGQGGPHILARYADGTTIMLDSLTSLKNITRWPQILAASVSTSSWRAASLVLLGGGAHHLASHWTCPGGSCPLPHCAMGYATQGKHGWFNAADDPLARGGRCASDYTRYAEATLGDLLNATHQARGVSATLVLQPPAAFPTASGEYHSPHPALAISTGGGGSGNDSATVQAARAALAPKLAARLKGHCWPLNSTPPSLTNEVSGEHWRNGVLRKLAARHRTRLIDPLPLLGAAPLEWHVGSRRTYTGTWDARAGVPATAVRSDCLHWCMHDRVWAPFLELIFSPGGSYLL